MKMMKLGLSALMLVVLVACQTMAPKTFNERLAAGYVTVTTVRQTATTLLDLKKIGSVDAQNIQQQANTARSSLDVARELHAAIPKAGEDKLVATLAILNTLTRYVEQKQKETK